MLRLLPLIVAAGCLPNEKDLYGLWANLDMNVIRGFEFADAIDDPDLDGHENVYLLYLYEGGFQPVVSQKGLFSTDRFALNSADGDERPALITEVLWSTDSALVGQTFGNEIVNYEDTQLSLWSATAFNNTRTYLRVDELP